MKLTRFSLQIGIVVAILSIFYTAYELIPKLFPKTELDVEIQSCEVLAPHYIAGATPLNEVKVKHQITIDRLHKYLKDSIPTIEIFGVKIFNPDDSVFKFIKEIFIDSVTEKLTQQSYHQIEVSITNRTKKELTNLSIDMYCDACEGWVYTSDSLRSFSKGIIPLGNIGPKKSIVPKIFMTSNASYTGDRFSFFNSSASGGLLTYSNGTVDIPRVLVVNINSTWEGIFMNFMESSTFRFLFCAVFLLGLYFLFFKIVPVIEKKVKATVQQFKKKPVTDNKQ